MRMLSYAGVVLCSTVAFAAPNARLAEAKRLIEDLELEKAAKALDGALLVEGNDREALLEIWELQGVVSATLGKTEKAREAFRALLVLDANHQLAGAQPPRVRTPFYEAKDWAAKNGPLALVGDAQVSDTVQAVSVKVTGDALGMARVVAFHVDTDGRARLEKVRLERGGAAAQVKVGAPAVKWWAELLGEREAVLVRLGSEAQPREDKGRADAAAAPREQPKEQPREQPREQPKEAPKEAVAAVQAQQVLVNPWMRPTGYALLGAGAVAGGVGGFLGWQSADVRQKISTAARDPNGVVTGITQKQAADFDATARNSAVAANVLFVTAGVVAATGLVFAIAGGTTEDVKVSPGAGGFVVSGRF